MFPRKEQQQLAERFSKTRTKSHRRRQVPSSHTQVVDESNAKLQSRHLNFRFNIYPIFSSSPPFIHDLNLKFTSLITEKASFSSQFPQFSAKNHRKTTKTNSVKMPRTRAKTHGNYAQIHENKPFLGVNCRENQTLELEYPSSVSIVNIYILLYNNIIANSLDIISRQ